MNKARILLVEDDVVLRDLLTRNLLARGYEVQRAEDAQGALTQLRSAPFDLVLLDICLPDRTGWEMLSRSPARRNLHPLELDGSKLPVVVPLGGAGQFPPAGGIPPARLPPQALPAGLPAAAGCGGRATQSRWRCHRTRRHRTFAECIIR